MSVPRATIHVRCRHGPARAGHAAPLHRVHPWGVGDPSWASQSPCSARAFRRCWWARNRQGTCDQDRGHVRAAQLRQRRRARRTSTMPARPHRAQQLTAHRLTTHKTTGAQSHWSTKETKLSISPLYLIRSCIDLSFYLYFTDLAARASRTYSSSMSPAACRRSSRSSGTVPRALLGAWRPAGCRPATTGPELGILAPLASG